MTENLPATLQHKVARISERLRERALAQGTFDAELADDLEALAEVTATLHTIATRLEILVIELDQAEREWCHE